MGVRFFSAALDNQNQEEHSKNSDPPSALYRELNSEIALLPRKEEVIIVAGKGINIDLARSRIAQAIRQHWKIDFDAHAELQEITFHQADIPEDIAKHMGLNEISDLLNVEGLSTEEIIAPEINLTTQYGEAVQAELKRITQQPAKKSRVKIPINYLFRDHSRAKVSPDTLSSIDAIARTLYRAGALQSQRRYVFNFDAYNNVELLELLKEPIRIAKHFNSNVLNLLRGSTVVIQYGKSESNESFSRSRFEDATEFLEFLQPIAHVSNIVLVVPENNPDLEFLLWQHLPGPHVDCERQAPPTGTDKLKSYEYLEQLAAEAGVSTDRALLDPVDEAAAKKATVDLRQHFHSWLENVLIRDYFPQYQEYLNSQPRHDPWQELNSLVGLDAAKEHIRQQMTALRVSHRLAREGISTSTACLNAIFLGSPGTGKTELARVYAKILRAEGAISQGRLVEVKGCEMILPRRHFGRAKGGVLFIDEAYGIPSKSIPEVVAEIENQRADTVVIMAGYEQQMKELLESNPGFRSRFPTTLTFEDYSPAQQYEIFLRMAKNENFIVDDAASSAARQLFERVGRRTDEGNARYVRNVFETARTRQRARLSEEEFSSPEAHTLRACDIAPEAPSTAKPSARERLSQLIGLDAVKSIVSGRLSLMRVEKGKRDRGLATSPIPMHMAFTGNPGTGKTEVATLVAEILREEKILSVGELFHVGRQDLVSEYVGYTATKVKKLFERARGSVIFIDEAYSLLEDRQGGVADEAIATLIDQMEQHREEVVVILAGYTEAMDRLFERNAGFRSRITSMVEFPDYSPAELGRILELMASDLGLILGPGVTKKCQQIFAQARGLPDFGNARFVRTLLDGARTRQSRRLLEVGLNRMDDATLLLLEAEDFHLELPARQPTGMGFQFALAA